MKNYLLLALSAVALLFAFCKKNDPDVDKPMVVAVTGVSLNTNAVALEVDDSVTLTATVAPDDATNKAVSWSSADDAIATVKDGVVTAVAAGETTVTVTTVDGDFKATANVVVKAAPIKVTGVTLDKPSLELEVGDSDTLTATVAPDDATNKAVIWSSADDAIATVEDGVVTAVAAGETTVTVTTVDGGFTASATVTVAEGIIKVTGVTLDKPSLELEIGESDTLTATVAPDDATNKAVSWSSANDAIATVEDGVVTAVAAGETTVTVTTVDGDFKATANVVVKAAPIKVTGVSLDKTMVALEIGESVTVEATVTPETAVNKEVKWSIADTAVATVSNGVVTGVAEGETELTVTTADGGHTATIPVKVVTEKVAVTGIELICPSNVKVGDSATLTVRFFPAKATNHALSFVIDNPECVKISYQQTEDNRVMYSITGVQDGIVKIKAVSEDGGFESKECAVVVAAILPTGVTFDGKTGLSQENIFLTWHGKVVDLKAKAEPEGASLKTFFWGLEGANYACAPVWKYNITDDKATVSVVLPEDEQSPQDVRTTVVAKLSEKSAASAKAIIVSRCCFWCYRSFSDGNISKEGDILHFGPQFYHKNEYFRWDATGDRKFENGWYFVAFCPPISETLTHSSELYYKESYIPADEYTLTSTSKNIKITKMENVCYKVERTKWDAYEEFTLTYTCGEYVYNIPCRLIP